jgi:hypothetical protein
MSRPAATTGSADPNPWRSHSLAATHARRAAAHLQARRDPDANSLRYHHEAKAAPLNPLAVTGQAAIGRAQPAPETSVSRAETCSERGRRPDTEVTIVVETTNTADRGGPASSARFPTLPERAFTLGLYHRLLWGCSQGLPIGNLPVSCGRAGEYDLSEV